MDPNDQDRRRKRKRSEMQDDADSDMQFDEMLAQHDDAFLWFFAIAVAAVSIATQYEYIMGIPPPLIPDLRFDLENCGTALTMGLQCEHLFRFGKDQLRTLVQALRIPAILRTPERDRFHAIEGICIVLRRLTHGLGQTFWTFKSGALPH